MLDILVRSLTSLISFNTKVVLWNRYDVNLHFTDERTYTEVQWPAQDHTAKRVQRTHGGQDSGSTRPLSTILLWVDHRISPSGRHHRAGTHALTHPSSHTKTKAAVFTVGGPICWSRITFPLSVRKGPTLRAFQLRTVQVVVSACSERTGGRVFLLFSVPSLLCLKTDRLNRPNLR